jgi:alpha-1,2-mannosyltransferase
MILKFLKEAGAKRYPQIVIAVILMVTGYLYLALGSYWIAQGLLTRPGLTDIGGKPVGADFVTFWSASKLARSENPAAVYVIPRLHEVEKAVIGENIPTWAWYYPPSFLLLVLPLSFLPYLAALGLWIGGALLGYARLVHRIAPHRLTPWLLLAFPFVGQNFFYGQNGFISALLLGGGILWLDSRPWAAGGLLGLLSYKPQLAFLIPVVLVAGGHRQALVAAAATAGGLALASLAVLGPDTWAAFWATVPLVQKFMDRPAIWSKMPTVYASARLLGASLPVALIIQGLASVVVIGAISWVWRRQAPLCWRGSILAVGIFLATPYAFEYDLAVLGLAFAWLGWEEFAQENLFGQAFLALCWVALYLVNYLLPMRQSFQATPLILLALLSFILFRTYRTAPTKPTRLMPHEGLTGDSQGG